MNALGLPAVWELGYLSVQPATRPGRQRMAWPCSGVPGRGRQRRHPQWHRHTRSLSSTRADGSGGSGAGLGQFPAVETLALTSAPWVGGGGRILSSGPRTAGLGLSEDSPSWDGPCSSTSAGPGVRQATSITPITCSALQGLPGCPGARQPSRDGGAAGVSQASAAPGQWPGPVVEPSGTWTSGPLPSCPTSHSPLCRTGVRGARQYSVHWAALQGHPSGE